ncbi:hypothetical protein GCM10008905_03120 [Clostridium malenominatum]|uniref:Twitching motility protein PilT n=1 Tax=Clostridium malenominatum TaxID=1539 RepID=A0ABP3TX61_9CLOT
MIQVLCGQRGAGKTKALIEMANKRVDGNKGHIVFVDDDKRIMFELHRDIRFVSTSDYNLRNHHSFYGFLCGILSSNYDIDTIFVDGLANIINLDIEDAAYLFYELEVLEKEYGVDFIISVNEEEMVECMRKYVKDLVAV